jgi:hypothetical protein
MTLDEMSKPVDLGIFMSMILVFSLTTVDVRAEVAYSIVRSDEENARLFVADEGLGSLDQPGFERLVAELTDFITQRYPHWGGRWSLSFFLSPVLAGYKDEPAIAPAVASGVWAEGYVAEYSNYDRLLVKFPALSQKRTEQKLKP